MTSMNLVSELKYRSPEWQKFINVSNSLAIVQQDACKTPPPSDVRGTLDDVRGTLDDVRGALNGVRAAFVDIRGSLNNAK